MGSFGFAALAALLLAFALLPHPEAARVLQGEKPRSSEVRNRSCSSYQLLEWASVIRRNKNGRAMDFAVVFICPGSSYTYRWI
jgi:hypothetical protein